MKKSILILFLQLTCIQIWNLSKAQNSSSLSPKRDNPGFIRDRKKDLIDKPDMPTNWINRNRQLYDPAWMDYCDPYHCNDYHSMVCGLNRRKMKFKWFQSVCHLIVNNQCATYRGNIKFDLIEKKWCHAYVMFLRSGCPQYCHDDVEPLCGQSSVDGHVVIFKNQCSLEMANCRNSTLQEYDEVKMSICDYKILETISEL